MGFYCLLLESLMQTNEHMWDVLRIEVPSWFMGLDRRSSCIETVKSQWNRECLGLKKKIRCLAILPHDGVPGSFDPLRDPNAGPTTFKMTVSGHLRSVWWSSFFYLDEFVGLSLLDEKIFDFQNVEEFREEEIQNEFLNKENGGRRLG